MQTKTKENTNHTHTPYIQVVVEIKSLDPPNFPYNLHYSNNKNETRNSFNTTHKKQNYSTYKFQSKTSILYCCFTYSHNIRWGWKNCCSFEDYKSHILIIVADNLSCYQYYQVSNFKEALTHWYLWEWVHYLL